MNEEKQKDGGILRSEEEKTGHAGYYDFNKLQEQKQTLTRAKKVLRATPRSTVAQCRQLHAGRGNCAGEKRQGPQ